MSLASHDRPRALQRASAALWTALGSAALLAPASSASAQPPELAEPSTPLSVGSYRIAHDVPDEGTPDPGEHYPVSNEWRHDLWFDHVRDLRGAFVGVGTDQCYTLAAVQDARLLWVVDFDPLVPLVHRLYGGLVPASETPEQLVERFSEDAEDDTVRLLGRLLAADPHRGDVVGAYRRNRERMHAYLRRVQRNVVDGQPASWLADPALYARIRALHRANRVIARNGDVTADGALRAVGRAAARLEVPVRVLYFSNAEQFFPYGADFRENLAALPTDERSVVLRTFRGRHVPYPEGDRWHYMVQPAADMRVRLGEGGYRHSRQLIMDLLSRPTRYLGEDGLSVLDASIPRHRG